MEGLESQQKGTTGSLRIAHAGSITQAREYTEEEHRVIRLCAETWNTYR